MVQGQSYMADVTSLPNQALIIFGERLKIFFDRCVQFVQLKIVDIRIKKLIIPQELFCL